MLIPPFFYLNTYRYKTGHVRHTSLLDKQLIEPNGGGDGSTQYMNIMCRRLIEHTECVK